MTVKIGIISDTHDDVEHLQRALELLRREHISVVIHCGDLTGARLVPFFEGFELHLVRGNMDHAPEAIAQAVRRLGHHSTYDLIYTGELEGVRVAALHGDDDEARKALQRSGLYAYVFHGHTHKRKDRLKGDTRVINPGALGGLRKETRSFCILHLDTGQARFVEWTP